MNNFNYITPEDLIKQHPDSEQTLDELKKIRDSKSHLCDVCETEQAWKYGQSGMCFSCTTGESDASDDYELI